MQIVTFEHKHAPEPRAGSRPHLKKQKEAMSAVLDLIALIFDGHGSVHVHPHIAPKAPSSTSPSRPSKQRGQMCF